MRFDNITKPLTVEMGGLVVHFEYRCNQKSPALSASLGSERRKMLYRVNETNSIYTHNEARKAKAMARLESEGLSQDEEAALEAQIAGFHTLSKAALEEFEKLQQTTTLLDAEEVCRLVAVWDVEDEVGPIPTTDLQRVAALPEKLLDLIQSAIDEDCKIPPPTSPGSSSSSTPEESSATAPTGTSLTK